MYGLEVRIGSARGLVSVPAYRGLLDEVRALLTQVDQQARVSPDGQPWGVMGEPVEWGVRHEQSLTGLTLRVEPFDIAADGQRVLRAVQAVVRGVRELAAQPVIPPYYSEDAVSRLARVAGRRGSNGIDRLDLAAVNGQVLDQVEVSEAVRQNARESVRAATTGTSTVEGVVDALAGGAKNKLRPSSTTPRRAGRSRSSCSPSRRRSSARRGDGASRCGVSSPTTGTASRSESAPVRSWTSGPRRPGTSSPSW